MSFDYNNQIYSKVPFRSDFAINAPLAKPIETVQKTIETSVGINANDKKSHKTRNAIAVGSSVLVLSALVALMNPRFSPKVIEKLKSLSEKAEKKADKNKHDTLLSKFYGLCQSASDGTVRSIRFVNNFNSGKDLGFKWFCTEKKDFLNIRNKSTRRVFKKADSGIRKVFTKPYNAITNFFDNISKHTVLSKYKKSSGKLNSLDEIIKSYKDKLPESEKLKLETKLTEIDKAREYFKQENTLERFKEQEHSMANLERDFWARYRKYRNGFSNKWLDKGEHINKNLSFWAEDIMKPAKEKFVKSGEDAVSVLVGNGNDKKGAYNEIKEILAPHLSSEEKSVFEKQLSEASQSLKKANYSECVEYFDKKRDLVLGSAPTDIVTAIVGLTASGVALSTADSRDERVSKLLTKVLPIMGGLGASMVFAARLVSGPVGMLSGAGVGVVLNILGSFLNKNILGNKEVNDG